VDGGAYCLAEPGRVYAVYVPMGRRVNVRLRPDRYDARWFNPRTGKVSRLPRVTHSDNGAWAAPEPPDHGDWALLLTRVGP
jgi:hypothetical protein